MEEIEDCDMECEQIHTDENGFSDTNHHEMDMMGERPNTPLNISGIISVNHEEMRPVTPPNNFSTICGDIFNTPNNDTSFIKRAGIDKLMSRSRGSMPPMTSTPFLERDRLSNTLPSTFTAPSLAHLINERQCRSSETVRRRSKVGPEGIPYKYMNPFTPDGKLLENKLKAQKKMQRSAEAAAPPIFRLNKSTEMGQSVAQTSTSTKENDIYLDLDDIPRRARLKEFNVNRYHEEFVQLQQIGKGEYGCVYKCVNRLNGCLYAIKKSIKNIKNGLQERTIRNEIFAHGVLFHPNIVRNFSCWKEEGFIFIQNEYCNGGNLEKYMETNTMSESLLRNLLLQMASALKYMHKVGLGHMDIKPGNILLCIETHKESSLESDGGFSDEDRTDEITFKLGDLGHVSRLDEDDAEEGDCRYLSREIIEERYTNLDRADIFSLGLTVYEAAGGGPLPKNGDDWHEIRNGNLKYLDAYTKEFNEILKKMIDPVPTKRPSASDLVEMLKPSPPSPTADDVSTYIQNYRRTSTQLEHTAIATNQYLKELFKSHRHIQEQLQNKDKVATPSKDKLLSLGKKKGAVTKTRVIGRKTKRSSSTTTF